MLCKPPEGSKSYIYTGHLWTTSTSTQTDSHTIFSHCLADFFIKHLHFKCIIQPYENINDIKPIPHVSPNLAPLCLLLHLFHCGFILLWQGCQFLPNAVMHLQVFSYTSVNTNSLALCQVWILVFCRNALLLACHRHSEGWITKNHTCYKWLTNISRYLLI